VALSLLFVTFYGLVLRSYIKAELPEGSLSAKATRTYRELSPAGKDIARPLLDNMYILRKTPDNLNWNDCNDRLTRIQQIKSREAAKALKVNNSDIERADAYIKALDEQPTLALD
jgi:hypothetical protein